MAKKNDRDYRLKCDTEEEMAFDDLTITGNYNDYDILEEEK